MAEVPELAGLVTLPGAYGAASAVAVRGVGIQLVERMVGHGENICLRDALVSLVKVSDGKGRRARAAAEARKIFFLPLAVYTIAPRENEQVYNTHTMVEQESLFIQLLVRVGSRVGCGCVKGLLVERCKLSQGERREDRAGVHKQLTCYVSGEERVLLLIHVGYEVCAFLFIAELVGDFMCMLLLLSIGLVGQGRRSFERGWYREL